MTEYINGTKRKALFEQERAAQTPPPITRYYLDAYLSNIGCSPLMREAIAQKAAWQSVGLAFSHHDLLAGAFHASEPVGFHYGCGTYVNSETAKLFAEQEGYSGDELQNFHDMLDTVRSHGYNYFDESVFNDEEMASLYAHAATTTWFGGHMVLDYERVLMVGPEGYRAEIADCHKAHGGDRADFFDAMDVQLDGVVSFICRLADETAAAGGDFSDIITANLRHIAKHPPADFWQALQLVWILHLLDNSDSFGRFDYYLLPFFEKDMESGALTLPLARALLSDFWIKIEQSNQIQNMTLGGVDTDNKPAYSMLTLICLETSLETRYKGPNISLRVTPDMPDNIWEAATNCLAAGLGQPALYNDPLYVASLVRSGLSETVARGYCLAGCSQIMIPGQSNFVNDIGLLNVGKIAELTLNDGYDTRTKAQIGPHTGTVESFDTFDSLYTAFLTQLDYFCDMEVSIHNKEIPYRASREGYTLRTLFTRDCLSKAAPVFEGGARYNNVQLELIGITNAADHFYAIKKLIFDNSELTLRQLADLLAADWQGGDGKRWQQRFRSLPKFGNGCTEVDEIRADISRFLYERFNSIPAPLGGIYVPGEVVFTAHEGCGSVTGATADGRSSGQVFADSAGASGGMDLNGPTALFRSVLTIPAADYLLTSVVTNLRLMPDLFANKRKRNALRLLFQSFFNQNGMQLQINVCDSEELRRAQENPEQYRHLIVRVGGYSDYFVRLSRVLQDEIITRTAHSV